MPIQGPWRKIIPEQVRNAPDYPGVYELADILQDLIYIGHTESLARTMEQLLDRRDPAFATAHFFRFQTSADHAVQHQALIDEYVSRLGQAPPLNRKRD